MTNNILLDKQKVADYMMQSYEQGRRDSLTLAFMALDNAREILIKRGLSTTHLEGFDLTVQLLQEMTPEILKTDTEEKDENAEESSN